MTRRAFFITGDRVIHLANACGAGLAYQAQQQVVMPGTSVGPHCQEQAETLLLIETGSIEVMVNGLAAMVSAGGFVRIPAKAWFAYRNDMETPARVLCRTSPVQAARECRHISIQVAAA